MPILYNIRRGDTMSETSTYKMNLIHSEHLANEYFCFDFQKPNGYVFKEGQFCLFEIINKNITGRTSRAFSIASTNDEQYIRVATRIVGKCSDYKEVLKTMAVGDEISMSEPKGKFCLEEDFDGVFIAGGIGITPIRSMLLSKERIQSKRNDVLIYSELEKCYPFKEELESLSYLEIQYAADIEPTQKLIIDNAKKYQNSVFYYVSGSPGFVNGIRSLLIEQGIQPDHIKNDLFVGY